MDLIYADAGHKDIGILDAYFLDMAYGADENDFELTVDKNSHCCEAGYFIYAQGEEYGGIIDSVKVDTEKSEITYSGRTWQGVIESKIITPLQGDDFLILSGEANNVLQQLIHLIDLSSLFTASTADSGIDIANYQMERYISGYSGIAKMLRANDAKLKFKWQGEKVILWAEPRCDYSQDEEFDTSQVAFTLKKNYKPVNHIICLGQGDLKDRAVIHIFTDENGGIQPVAKTDNPLQDSDYILSEDNKVLFGENEVAAVLNYSNAEIKKNYIPLLSKPDDWDDNCVSYFLMDEENGKYINVKTEEQTEYIKCASAPSDWSTAYGSYYVFENDNYNAVQGVTDERYYKQNAKPADWESNWSSYFVYYSDGISSEYKSVDGVTKYKYTVQTQKPTDWNSNYSNYYKKKSSGGYEKVELDRKSQVPTWKAKTYYTQTSYQVAPEWKGIARYTKKTYTVAPVWRDNYYYTANKYTAVPAWVPLTYFREVEDRYATMVASAIEKLEEAHKADELTIDLEETDQTYDIGDLVGTIEGTTGITAVQEVIKKIIKIQNNDISITYEVN